MINPTALTYLGISVPDWDYLEHLARKKQYRGFLFQVVCLMIGFSIILGVLWLL